MTLENFIEDRLKNNYLDIYKHVNCNTQRSNKMKTTLTILAAVSTALATPAIPQTFTATITSNTTGTSKAIPQGVQTYKQFYDYTNKRLRKDASNGMTKVYRYDKQIMPPITPGPMDPDFASPKGYQFQLNNPNLNCCWL